MASAALMRRSPTRAIGDDLQRGARATAELGLDREVRGAAVAWSAMSARGTSVSVVATV